MSAGTKSAASSAAILALSLDAIVESPDNPRKHFDAAFIAELAGSLAKSGQFTPCLVRPHPKQPGKYELAAGATRLRAARAAKLERLDCIVRAMDDAQFLELLTFENLKRRDLQPMEEARGYALLQKRLEGWTVEKLAERSGVSPDYVRDRLRLLKLAPAAVELLESHRIPLTHALEIAKLGEKAQKRVIDDGLFDGEEGQYSVDRQLLKELGRDQGRGEKVVSLAELRRFIDDNVRVDIDHPELEFLLPATHAQLEQARKEKRRIIWIGRGHIDPEIRGNEKIVAPGSWRRADGLEKSKKCDFAVLGVVAGSDASRGQAWLVCTRKDKCEIHWAQHVKRAKQRAAERAKEASRSSTPAKGEKAPVIDAAAEKRQKEKDARESEAREALAEAEDKARGEAIALIAAAVTKAKPATFLGDLLKSFENMCYLPHDSQKEAALVKKGSTSDDALRRMYWLTLLDDNDGPLTSYAPEGELGKVCKRFGINFSKLIEKHTPAPKVEKAGNSKKAAAQSKAKKKGKAKR
jgi:ParB family chromosome partitioning protein